jgi:hypothetical protein
MVAGGLLLARGTTETRQVGSIFSIAMSALVILFPTVLIGMGKMTSHQCRMTTLPEPEHFGVIVMMVGGYLVGKRE